MSSKRIPGTVFEKAVAELQALMEKNSQVIHDEKIIDRIGQARQFDVVIRGKFAGYDLLGVIECKDWKAKVDVPVVDAFITKSRDINANFSVIASNSGFTKKALEKCKANNIGAYSLLGKESSIKIETPLFAELHKWTHFAIGISGSSTTPIPNIFSIADVYVGDQSVFEWFLNHLNNLDNEEEILFNKDNEYVKDIAFKTPQQVTIGSVYALVSGMTLTAYRSIEVKRKWARISGNAFYDWNEETLILPPKGSILTAPIEMDLENWDTYHGEYEVSGPFGLSLRAFRKTILKNEVIDIENL